MAREDPEILAGLGGRIPTQEDVKTCSKSNRVKDGRSGIRIQDSMVHGLLALLPYTRQELRIKCR